MTRRPTMGLTQLLGTTLTTLAITAAFAGPAQAQVNTEITATTDLQALQDALLADTTSITVTDVEYTGAGPAIGTYIDGPQGMPDGLAISTGNVVDMSYREPQESNSSTSHNTPGSALCEQLTGGSNTNDAATLRITFDLDANADGIGIDHIVGTQEYPEYVGGSYNDGFGIFVNGDNIALSLDGNPVTVNAYFDDEDVIEWPENQTNFDGTSTYFTSFAPLTPGSTDNVLEVVICDAGDTALDTGAFLAAFDSCTGDCTGTIGCGDDIVQDGEQCDGTSFAAGFDTCPDGYVGTPLCNNDPSNPDGGGSCTVDPTPDGCSDIDECADDPNICGPGTCNNTDGSYDCACDEGYEFDGTSCVNVDECADDSLNDCDENATCTDTDGGFDCACDAGYGGDGQACFLEVVIDEPGDGTLTNNPRPTFEGTGEPGQLITLSADGVALSGTTVDGNGDWSITPGVDLDDGDLTIEATDGTTSDTINITVDTTPPALSVATPDGLTNNDQPPVTGTAEPGALIAIDTNTSTAVVTADSNGDWTYTPDPLADGPYEWDVTATDAAGNSSAGSATFEVDTVAPPLAVNSPSGAISDDSPEVTGTSEPGATITITFEDGTTASVTTDADGDWTYAPGTLADGPYAWDVTASDAAGNTTTDSATFEVDTEAPPLAVDSPQGLINDATPTVSGTSEPGATITITFEDGSTASATADSNGDWTYPTTAALDDGDYSWDVTASDDAGNTTEDTAEFELDTVAPPLAVNSPSGAISDDSPEVTGTSEPGATITITFEDGTTATVTADSSGDWSYTPAPLADGPYAWDVTASDAAGNTTTDSATFEVDTEAPPLAVDSPQGLINDAMPEVSGTSEPGATITITFEDGSTASVTADDNGDWTYPTDTPLDDGEYAWDVTASDEAGNTTEDSAEFEVDTEAPPLTVNGPDEFTNDNQPELTGTSEPGATITITDENGDTHTVTADDNGDWSWTPDGELDDGDYSWDVTASDEAGNTTSETVDFTVDTEAPELVIDTPESPTNDRQPPISGTAEPGSEVTITDGDGNTHTVTVDDDGNWSWQPDEDLDDGEYSWDVEITDDAGNTTSETVDIDVDTEAPMVQIRTPDDEAVLDASPDMFEGDAEANAQVDLFIDGEEVGVTTADADGEWSFDNTDDLDDGTYVLVARATDEAGNQSEDTHEFTIDTTDGVQIASPADGDTVRTGEPTFTGTAEPNETVEIVIDGEVVDTVESDEDGNWSWQPDEVWEDGEITVTARTDSASGGREDTVTFDVDTSTTDVVINNPSDGDIINDSQPDITGTAAPDAEITIFIDGEEVGTTVANGNGTWSFSTDDDLDDGDHEITAVADDETIVTDDTVDITVDTAPPSLVVESPEDGAEVAPGEVIVSGSAEPEAVVEVYVNGQAIGSTTADEDGNWELPVDEDQVAALEAGEQDLRVTATDEAGNVAVDERTFILLSDEEVAIANGYMTGGGVGCAATSGGPQSLIFFLALIGLAAFRRRRDHRA